MALGERIGRLLWPGAVLALEGTLAAGKTTLTKGIARGLDIDEEVTSPTFTLISEYPGRLPLYHMDAYRLSGSDEFADLGTDDLLYGQGVCVVEWSEKVRDRLPPDTIFISIALRADGARTITVRGSRLERELS